MSLITKLLELCLMGQAISASKVQIGRMMKGMAAIIFLAIISSILALLALGCCYAIVYVSLIGNGFTPIASLAILLAFTLICLAILMTLFCKQWCRLPLMSEPVAVPRSSPLTDVGTQVLTAFLAGFERKRTNASTR